MKRLLCIAVLALAAGCGTTREDRCGTYSTTYELYLASTQIGRPVSSEEAAAATAAALFLRTYCGWTPTRGADAHGVPVIVPPGGWPASRPVPAPLARPARTPHPAPQIPGENP